MLQRASESIDHFTSDDPELTSLTCCVDEESITAFKQLIGEFRRECIDRAEATQVPSPVIQINIQLFPLSTEDSPT